MGVGEVLDVDVVAILRSVSGDREGFPGERLPHEAGDHQLLAHPRAVRDPVAQDRVVELVQRVVAVHEHLRGELARRVDVIHRAR